MSPARVARRKGRRSAVIWLVPAGVVLALWAVWSLATAPREPAAGADPKAAPSGEIGDSSRAALREILRGADGEDDEGAR